MVRPCLSTYIQWEEPANTSLLTGMSLLYSVRNQTGVPILLSPMSIAVEEPAYTQVYIKKGPPVQ